MSFFVRYLPVLLLVISFSEAHSQPVQLRIISNDGQTQLSKITYNKKPASVSEAQKQLSAVLTALHYEGYLLASADSIEQDSLSVRGFVTVGDQFRSAHIRLGNLDPGLASKLGISEKLYFNKPFRYKEVAGSIEKIIAHYENNGFPFVTVKLDSVETDGNLINGVFNVKRNKFFKLDSVRVIGDAKVHKIFLERYLGVKEGMPYNENSISQVSSKIKQLAFLSEKQSPRVQLTERNNKLLLFLDKKNASQFDGIIGLLPDADTKKTIVTGDVKLKLVNGILRNGETFDLEWRRLRTQTQDFNGRVIYPYLFGTPIGIDYNLKIYRKDSTFLDLTNNIGLQYYFKGLNNFKVYYKQRNTNIISTAGLDFATTLPEYADITTQSYGIGTTYEKLDYRFNPHKGIALIVNAQTGVRSIRKNPRINPVAYENVLLKSTQYQFESTLSGYIRLMGHNVLRLGLQAASVFGNSTVFRNELFRIGGLKTLRGFDEESIYASTYVIPTIEYRFLFAQNSNLLLFTEGAWYENNSNHLYLKDTPVSVGAGINFETKAGILSLTYALGNQQGNGFDARSGKIHFGLTALF
jgi:translocation and assembly module TamA